MLCLSGQGTFQSPEKVTSLKGLCLKNDLTWVFVSLYASLKGLCFDKPIMQKEQNKSHMPKSSNVQFALPEEPKDE
jgi:hypothetical protein